MPSIDPALIKRNKEVLTNASTHLDQVSEAWARIEKFFQDQGVLTEANVKGPAYVDKHPRQQEESELGVRHLSVRKVSGSWRLCHGVCYHDLGDEPNWALVADASIEVRLALLKYVPDLFARVVEANEAFATEIEKGKTLADSVLNDLGIAD